MLVKKQEEFYYDDLAFVKYDFNYFNELFYLFNLDYKMYVYLNMPLIDTPLKLTNFLNNILLSYNNLNYYNYLILNSGKIIGSINLYNLEVNNDNGELGIFIFPNYQRQGFAYKSLSALINYAFNNLLMHKLKARVVIQNLSSLKLFLKLGFKEEGISKESFKLDDKYLDVVLLSLINK